MVNKQVAGGGAGGVLRARSRRAPLFTRPGGKTLMPASTEDSAVRGGGRKGVRH